MTSHETGPCWLYWVAIGLWLLGWVFWYVAATEPPPAKVIIIR
jgi:hypothetical protein